MSTPLFPKGYQGLADSRWSGIPGSVAESVGIDHQSTPGLIKVHQKLSKDSGDVVDELCKAVIDVSDGSRLWFSNESGKIWREVSGTYTLVYTNTYNSFDVRTASFDSPQKAKNVSSQTDLPSSIKFKPDGTVMYVMGIGTSSGTGGEIFQYTLSTAWDVSTATYASKTTTTTTGAKGFWIKPDGTRFWICEDDTSGPNYRIIPFDLATPWDISTTVPVGFAYDFSGVTTRGSDIVFKSDGTKLLLLSLTKLVTFSLSTPWDISTMSVSSEYTLTGFTGFSYFSGLGVDPTGGKIYIYNINGTDDGLEQFNLTTPWEASSIERPGLKYVTPIGSESFGLYIADDGSGFYTAIQSSPEIVYQYNFEEEDTEMKTLDAHEFRDYIYWATKNQLFRIAVADIATFTEGQVEYYATFTNGDDTYHPMIEQNLALWIGNGKDLTYLDQNHFFFSSSSFNLPEGERITCIDPYDIDLVIGTKTDRYGRILRWDTFSDSWSAEDIVYEAGVTAFIRDDNFLHAYCGDLGNIYFYNGEKLEKSFPIRGNWNASNRAVVHQYSTGYLNGIPVFGLSTVAGTPCKMGVYTLGRYSPSYPLTLSLSYPVGETYDSIEFGALVTSGPDMWVSTNDGIYKLDWENKYEYAHFETRQLTPLELRSTTSQYSEFMADYVSLPANTNITFSYRDKYANSFVSMTSVTDSKKEQVFARLSIPDVTSMQLRVDFTVSGNNAPEVENFATD